MLWQCRLLGIGRLLGCQRLVFQRSTELVGLSCYRGRESLSRRSIAELSRRAGARWQVVWAFNGYVSARVHARPAILGQLCDPGYGKVSSHIYEGCKWMSVCPWYDCNQRTPFANVEMHRSRELDGGFRRAGLRSIGGELWRHCLPGLLDVAD